VKSNKKRMTDRQARAWGEALAALRSTHMREAFPSDDPDDWRWTFHWDEETRPGRGQSLTAVFMDGEDTAVIRSDVYGSWTLAVGTVDWTHSDEDDECTCEPCTEQRRIEEARWR
jgi:hypothetical protein